MLDVYGREIKVGDWITYPVRQGSCVWLSHSKVTEIIPHEDSHVDQPIVKAVTDTGRKTTVRRVDRLIKAPKGWTP